LAHVERIPKSFTGNFAPEISSLQRRGESTVFMGIFSYSGVAGGAGLIIVSSSQFSQKHLIIDPNPRCCSHFVEKRKTKPRHQQNLFSA